MQKDSSLGKEHMALAGPNPKHMDEDFYTTAYPKVHENLKLRTDEHVILENPESSSVTLSSTKNLDETDNFGDQFLNDKPTEDDQEKTNVVDETDSIIPDLSHQTNTSAPPVTTPVINISSPKPSSQVNAPPINTEATTIITTIPEITLFIALQLRVAKLEQDMYEVKKTGTKVDDALLKALEKHTADLIQKYSGLPAPESSKKQESEKSPEEILRIKREQEEQKHVPTYTIKSTDTAALKEFDLKAALFKTIHENKSANRNPANNRLCHALMKALIEDENAMEKEVADKPHAHTSSAWKITDIRDAPSGSLMPRSEPQSEQSSDDIQIHNEEQDSDSDDNDNAHVPKVWSTKSWFSPIPEEDRPATPKPEWTIPSNDYPEAENNWANVYATTYQDPEENKLQRKTGDIGSFIKWFCKRTGKKKLCKADLEGPTFNLDKSFHKNSISLQFQMDECYKLLTDKVDLVHSKGHQILRNVYEPLPLGGPPDFGLEELVPSLWVESERDYDISAAYGITHWWVRRKEFYINKHREPSDRDAVRSHMRILSVICIKTYERYEYNYLREIVLRRADYKKYKISKKDFKNLHPNDFEDLFLFHLQDKLNHLPKSDKVNLHNAVNMWIRNIVIRKRVEDLQLGVENYQTKLNLEQPNWDVFDFLFKEDYTIVNKPRADKLDFMVKDFRLFKFNKGMETKKWTEDDKRRSEDFIEDTLPILLSFTHCGNKTILRVLRIILVILPEHPSETKVFHNEDGNPARANIKQALGRSHKGVKASANSDIVYFFTSVQDGNTLQDDERLDLADDLMKAQVHNQRQRIEAIEDVDGKLYSGNEVADQFVKYFQDVLGMKVVVDLIIDPSNLFVNNLFVLEADIMIRPISNEEIKAALFSIDDDKAPGPDGFSSKLFKASWSIVGSEVSQAIKDYFSTGQFPVVMFYISALVRQISDNILLTQELMRNYHRKGEPPKVAFKIDINKAFDSVDWGFLRQYDLMLFSNGDVKSVSILKSALDEFSSVSGLVPNLAKSMVFFGNVPGHMKNETFSIIPFSIGSLPIFWSSVFILLVYVSQEIKKIMRGFLWSQGVMQKEGLVSGTFGTSLFIMILAGVGGKFCKVEMFLESIWYPELAMAVVHLHGLTGEWAWLESWRGKFPFLFHLPPPLLFKDRKDKVLWLTNVAKNIPRHSFILWLAVNKKLKTQDRMVVWLRNDNLKCPLCSEVQDDHSHLLFGCKFSSSVWNFFKVFMKFESAPNDLFQILDFFSSIPINKSIWSIIQRLVLGAIDLVRFRILGLKVKSSFQALKAADI
ncbi:retrovirus-related pol polyprotein from transposon TNT 1-94 [Tanacetum coccineum]